MVDFMDRNLCVGVLSYLCSLSRVLHNVDSKKSPCSVANIEYVVVSRTLSFKAFVLLFALLHAYQ